MQQFTALEYLQMDIAARFGMDKSNWDVRLDWFHNHKNDLHSLVDDAKEPALFFAGVTAMDSVLAGQPTGYAPSMDCTASGMQLLSILTGDIKAARICNVIGDNLLDAYTEIYHVMLNTIGGTAVIEREDTKQAIMSSLYGSLAIPKEVFGEGHLLHIYHQTMEEEVPACWALNKFYLDIWDDQTDKYEWVYPDNFHVEDKVMTTQEDIVHFRSQPVTVYTKVNSPKSKGRSLGANTTHGTESFLVRELIRRCSHDKNMVRNVKRVLEDNYRMPCKDSDIHMVQILWDHYINSGFLSTRILQHINSYTVNMVDVNKIYNLIDSLPAEPFHILPTHK